MRDYFFPPLTLPLFLLLILLPFLFLLFAISISSAISYVLDMPVRDGMVVFLMIVIGSIINLPLYEKEGRIVERTYSFFGLIYSVRRRTRIVVAVNVGGCVIPVFLSLKILNALNPMAFLLSFALTSFAIYFFAKPVPGVGIAVPMFLPPVFSVFFSLLSAGIFSLSQAQIPKLAFSAGILGSLFGADILHLKDIEKIGSGVVSIGGAGTFDGIFLTGVFSVFFATLLL